MSKPKCAICGDPAIVHTLDDYPDSGLCSLECVEVQYAQSGRVPRPRDIFWLYEHDKWVHFRELTEHLANLKKE